ncbi:MAG: DUF2130 domain-containing protein [Saprospiraceae bacterium]|nr:DUF2130 domain-containing protein [Saprospiraceae bacterium]
MSVIFPKDKQLGDTSEVICPSCGHSIDVEKAIQQRTEQKLREEFNRKFVDVTRQLEADKKSLERERLEVKRLSSQTWEIIQEELKKERIRLADQLKQELEQKSKKELDSLAQALDKREKQNLELQRREVALLAEKQRLQNNQESLKLQLEREFMLRQQDMERKIKSEYVQQQDFQRIEYERKLKDQRQLIEEMTRKMQQGSMQIQGETQEVAIENYLAEIFTNDRIETIKTGARGADCMLFVRRKNYEKEIGRIYFESKRTKHFQNTWIEKFKGDMRMQKADLGVIVTQSMPTDMEHMGQKEGIWICTFAEMKILVPILRESLLQIDLASEASNNQESKMALLYQFLLSSEFRMQVEGIVEGFTQLQEELNREKRAMHGIWKRREKQIEKVLLNTNHMYSSIRGLAGSEIKSIKALEIEQ